MKELVRNARYPVVKKWLEEQSAGLETPFEAVAAEVANSIQADAKLHLEWGENEVALTKMNMVSVIMADVKRINDFREAVRLEAWAEIDETIRGLEIDYPELMEG